MNDLWKARVIKLWRDWIKPIAVVVIVLGTFRSAVADWNDVPTGSMKPTILEGDRILVNKLAYGLRLPFTDTWLVQWDGPQRGDVIVCFSPDTNERLVKRCVALPGDTVWLSNNVLLINGARADYEELDEDVINQIEESQRGTHRFAAESLLGETHPVMVTPGIVAKRNFGPVVVPEGHYFVMGDNRDRSRDSRFFGFVPRDKIVGRTGAIALSLNPDHHYLPRWERFLRSLP
ncbi:MAG: signal peptidase I [Phycisphaerae bacterium]